MEIKGLSPEGNASNFMEALLFRGYVKSCPGGWAIPGHRFLPVEAGPAQHGTMPGKTQYWMHS